MPAKTRPISHPSRRLLRFSVRGLILLVLVNGAWLGWLVRSARIQRAAVGKIESAGGSVSDAWESTDGTPMGGGTP
jgi:hypothetical protein